MVQDEYFLKLPTILVSISGNILLMESSLPHPPKILFSNCWESLLKITV